METNLKTIIKFKPCAHGITKLMNNLGHLCTVYNWRDVYNPLSKVQQTKNIDFKFILESNGVKDTFWGLCTQPEKIKMLISADIIESVLHLYEKRHPNDTRMRDYIQGIRDYCDGKITQVELNALKINVAITTYVDVVYTVAYAAAVTNRKKQWKKNEEILLKYI